MNNEEEEHDLLVNHEKYMGRTIPDPWDDPDQEDWPMNPSGGEDDGVGTDAEPGQAD